MTINIEVECDAAGCSNSAAISDYTDADIKHAGYICDPRTENFHYCHSCWPKVKIELDEDI
jgi:hypothetical protein